MKMQIVGLLVGLLLIAGVTYADYPLPELVPITVENAVQVSELAAVGGDLPGQLAWSPDGTRLAVGITSAVKIYDAHDWNKAPQVLAGGTDTLFDATGTRLVSGGGLWDVESGEKLADLGETNSYNTFSPSGDFLVTGRLVDGKAVVSLWSRDGERLKDLDTETAEAFKGAVFNADESLVALKLEDYRTGLELSGGVVQVWDVAKGRLLSSLDVSYLAVLSVQFVVNDTQILTHSTSYDYGGDFTYLRLWDVQTGELLKQWDDISDPVVNSMGAQMLTTRGAYGETGGVRLVYLFSQYEQIFENSSWPMFSPDSRLLGMIEDDGSAGHGKRPAEVAQDQISNFQLVLRRFVSDGFYDGEPTLRIPLYKTSHLRYQFSPDSRLVAIDQGDKLELWDLQRHNIAREIVTGETRDFHFNADGSLIVTQTLDALYLWDVATGEYKGTLPNNCIYTADCSLRTADETQSVHWEKSRVRISNMSQSDTLLTVIPDFVGVPLALNAAGEQSAFYGDDLRVFDLGSGLHGNPFAVESNPFITFTPDGTRLIIPDNSIYAGSYGLHIYNLPSSYQSITAPGLGDFISNMQGTLLGSYAFIGNQMYLIDTRTGAIAASWRVPGVHTLEIAFSPSGRFIAALSWTENTNRRLTQLSIWDVQEALRLGGNGVDGLRPVTNVTLGSGSLGGGSIVFSPDDNQVAVVTDDASFGDGPADHDYRIWLLGTDDLIAQDGSAVDDDGTGKILQTVFEPQFSPDGKYLLTLQDAPYWERHHTMVLWDAATDEQLAAVESDGTAAFSADGKLLATEGAAGVALYAVDALAQGTVEPLAVLPQREDVLELAWSPDGTMVFGRSAGRVMVWGVTTQ